MFKNQSYSTEKWDKGKKHLFLSTWFHSGGGHLELFLVILGIIYMIIVFSWTTVLHLYKNLKDIFYSLFHIITQRYNLFF